MVIRSSYIHNGNSYIGKMASLYWITPRGLFQYKVSICLYMNFQYHSHNHHFKSESLYGSGHETAAILLPRFAIN